MAESMRPFWDVVAVFDPQEQGNDFAYTVGLHDVSRPELHLWARPTDGLDPGLDWKLSQNDQGHLLNEFAHMLLDGNLNPGDTIEKTFDAGTAKVTFTVQEAIPSHELDAWQADPQSHTMTLSWELDRKPENPPQPVQQWLIEELNAKLQDLKPGAKSDWNYTQTWGTCQALIDARIDILQNATKEQTETYMRNTGRAWQHVPPTALIPIMVTEAREKGRSAVLDMLKSRSKTLAETLVENLELEDEELQSRAHFIFTHQLAADLMAHALYDRSLETNDSTLHHAATGPWDWTAKLGPNAPAGQLSHSDDLVAFMQFVKQLDPQTLDTLTQTHKTQRELMGPYHNCSESILGWVQATGQGITGLAGTLPQWPSIAGHTHNRCTCGVEAEEILTILHAMRLLANKAHAAQDIAHILAAHAQTIAHSPLIRNYLSS